MENQITVFQSSKLLINSFFQDFNKFYDFFNAIVVLRFPLSFTADITFFGATVTIFYANKVQQ